MTIGEHTNRLGATCRTPLEKSDVDQRLRRRAMRLLSRHVGVRTPMFSMYSTRLPAWASLCEISCDPCHSTSHSIPEIRIMSLPLIISCQIYHTASAVHTMSNYYY